MPLDPESLALLQQLAQSGAQPFHRMTPQAAREFLASLSPAYGEGPAMREVENVRIGDEGQTFHVRLLVPEGNVRGVIVHCHGGGWVTMAVDDFDTFGRQLASKTNCAVVLVDYRLAPEHPYPAALEDCWDALLWADKERYRITGNEEAPLIISGDSAGGNLAAVIAQRSARLGGPELALQVLVYPVTQSKLDGPSYLNPEYQLLLSRADMAWFWRHYQPDEFLRAQPECSPLSAPDLSGLPPAVVVTAEYDVLRDEGEAYARAMKAAGVPVVARCFEGQMHVFFTMVNVLSASADGIDFVAEQINARLSEISD